MAGKRLLPLLGGSAAVWTTCLVFFQIALLLGYFFAHMLMTRVSLRMQRLVYVISLALCLIQIVYSFDPSLHANEAHPILSVLTMLTVLIGVPFLVLSATGPLLQAWYVHCNAMLNPADGDSSNVQHPYRFFAISNAGSLLALLIYPWLIEPHFSLHQQSVLSMACFVVFTLVCTMIVYSIRDTAMISEVKPEQSSPDGRHPTFADRVLWILLAACGSLLLSAVTNYITQNVAAMPLLWIIPLIAYLLSFVVAFGREAGYPRKLIVPLFVVALAAVAYMLWDVGFDHLESLLHVSEINPALHWLVALFCTSLFLLCLFCHAELHRLRPSPRSLTGFYLCIAAGGALGAIFVGVLAPTFFSGSYELACGLVLASTLGLATSWKSSWLIRIFWAVTTVAMVMLIFIQLRDDRTDAFLQVRSFYGTLRVTQTIEPPDNSTVRTLYHGTIEHGVQIFTPDMRTEPTTYYSRDSGVGLALELCCEKRPRRVGFIGLGAGTLAAYGRKGDVFRFYEINSQIEEIAHNAFTYLGDSPATIEIVHGDARISLAHETPQHYDVLVIDAFSGDAIPVHLLTAEAFDLYQHHLGPSGILAFHVTNHFLDLAPVVQQQAERAGLKTALISTLDDEDTAAYSSDWVLVSADSEFLSRPEIANIKQPIVMPRRLRLWTDDYNSLLPVLRTKAD